jgi:uncharacterized membrane protein (DUF106 family)
MTAPPMPLIIAISIVVIGAAYTGLSILLQRKLNNPKRMRELQHLAKYHTAELNKLVKANAPKEHIDAKQKELYPVMSETMRRQMKPMLVIFPVFILMYYLVLPHIFVNNLTTFYHFSIFGAQEQLGLKGIFFYTVLILGFAGSMGILLYDKEKMVKEASERAAALTNAPK